MKKIDEKILLFLSGNLDETKQLELKQEIQDSPELKEQLFFYKEKLKELKDVSDTTINDVYFRNLVVRAKSRSKPTARKLLSYKLAYPFPVIIVLAVVLYFTGRNSSSFDKALTDLPESYTTSIINEIAEENDDIYSQDIIDTSSVEIITANIISNNDLGEKINSASISFSSDELNSNLTDEEINEIYNEMLKTKIL
ncbi:MAG: hypothetical protein C4539_07015 [Ignavibacteriales bacterium]|nr:MAG: hypothetical protein C4539_07015 [Ignavibacteriales bacterium]